VSDDGLTVVGFGTAADRVHATIWTPTSGMRSLEDVLTNDYGLNLGGWRLSEATSISGDGFTIVGQGSNPAGQSEAWIVTLPEPASSTCLVLLLVGVAMRRARRRAV
jgi:uncharacterized membrane protein